MSEKTIPFTSSYHTSSEFLLFTGSYEPAGMIGFEANDQLGRGRGWFTPAAARQLASELLRIADGFEINVIDVIGCRCDVDISSIENQIRALGWEPKVAENFNTFANTYFAHARRAGTRPKGITVPGDPDFVFGGGQSRVQAATQLLEQVRIADQRESGSVETLGEPKP